MIWNKHRHRGPPLWRLIVSDEVDLMDITGGRDVRQSAEFGACRLRQRDHPDQTIRLWPF